MNYAVTKRLYVVQYQFVINIRSALKFYGMWFCIAFVYKRKTWQKYVKDTIHVINADWQLFTRHNRFL